jgi:hypothetical protein
VSHGSALKPGSTCFKAHGAGGWDCHCGRGVGMFMPGSTCRGGTPVAGRGMGRGLFTATCGLDGWGEAGRCCWAAFIMARSMSNCCWRCCGDSCGCEGAAIGFQRGRGRPPGRRISAKRGKGEATSPRTSVPQSSTATSRRPEVLNRSFMWRLPDCSGGEVSKEPGPPNESPRLHEAGSVHPTEPLLGKSRTVAEMVKKSAWFKTGRREVTVRGLGVDTLVLLHSKLHRNNS